MSAAQQSFDAELVGAHPKLLNYARKRCSGHTNSEDSALDAVQDTHLRAIERRAQFLGGSVLGWMFAILKNTIRDHERKLKTRECEALFTDLATCDESGEYTDPEYADAGDPHSKLEATQTFDQINAMPILTATAMFCAGIGMTCSEIAERLGTSEANARQLLARGRQTLRTANDATTLHLSHTGLRSHAAR